MARRLRRKIASVKRAAKRVGETVAARVESKFAPSHMEPRQMIAMRDLFWCNVVRDMLNGLSILCQQQPEQFDGRFGVLTMHGERIPIGQITPLFACSVPGSPEERDASVAVQCTVFRIQTPEGEVFTMPVHEIRAIHTMTPELIEQLQALAEEEAEGETEGEAKPFGLAAFAALPKPPTAEQAAPMEPGE